MCVCVCVCVCVFSPQHQSGEKARTHFLRQEARVMTIWLRMHHSVQHEVGRKSRSETLCCAMGCFPGTINTRPWSSQRRLRISFDPEATDLSAQHANGDIMET